MGIDTLDRLRALCLYHSECPAGAALTDRFFTALEETLFLPSFAPVEEDALEGISPVYRLQTIVLEEVDALVLPPHATSDGNLGFGYRSREPAPRGIERFIDCAPGERLRAAYTFAGNDGGAAQIALVSLFEAERLLKEYRRTGAIDTSSEHNIQMLLSY